MRANLLGREKAGTRDRIVPYTVFIDPQLGRVGMTERQSAGPRAPCHGHAFLAGS